MRFLHFRWTVVFAICLCTCNWGRAEVLRDVPYCTNSGVVLKLDLYLPDKKSDKPMPLAVFVHGGGWQKGSKVGSVWLNVMRLELNKRGFVVASVDYRLAPKNKWPLFMNDVKCSIRFLRANARKFSIEPKRIGAWGTSAGGHLVAMLGTADESANLEGEHYKNQSSSVQAVVDFFGPTDIPLLVSERQHVERAKIVFGVELEENGMTNQAVLKEASPVTYVTKHSAPTMIIHGTRDELVHPNQAQVFYDKLKAAGVPTRMTLVRNGTHGLATPNIDPAREELVQQAADWLEHYVK
ncbi:MAG: lipase/esterase [Verrucomicrobiales bacterium]|nr:lipase/esterase [Verrucomicrobiales bacterium]